MGFGGAVELTGWFVGQEHARGVGERHGESGPGKFPAGKMTRVRPAAILQTERLQQIGTVCGGTRCSDCTNADSARR
jgi:hypothetical protein